MDLRAIREALAERLAEVASVRAFPFPPDQTPTGSATVVVIAPAEQHVDYQAAFAKGLAIVRYVISPYIPLVDPKSAFAELDALLSSGTGEARSLIDALMDRDRTYAGVTGDIVLDDVTNVQAISTSEGARYLTADLTIRVLVGRR